MKEGTSIAESGNISSIKVYKITTMEVTPINYLEINNSILSSFTTCFLIFIEYSPLIDYSSISYPLAKVETARGFSEPRNWFKVNHLNCVMTAVLLNPDQSELMRRNESNINAIVTSISYMQGMRIQNASRIQAPRHNSIPLHVLIFQQSYERTLDNFLMNELPSKLYKKVPVTLPLFFLYYTVNSDAPRMREGYFYNIKHEENKDAYRHFDCRPFLPCGSMLMDTLMDSVKGGRGVLWKFTMNIGRPSENLTAVLANSLLMSEVVELAQAALESPATGSAISFQIPTFGESIYLDYRDFPSSGVRLYFTGSRKIFRFITSDGASKVFPSLRNYLMPFSNGVWMTILIVPLLLSTMVAISTRCMLPQFASDVILWQFAALVEQPRPSLSTVNLPRLSHRYSILLRLCWLPFAFTISALYRASWQSKSIATFPFEIQWTHIKQLLDHDFDLFLPFSDSHCDEMTDSTVFNRTPTEIFKKHCPSNPCELCRFIDGLKTSNVTTDIDMRIHVTCERDIEGLVNNELKKPKTAIIFPALTLGRFWRLVQNAMLKNRELRYHYNSEVNDDFLSTEQYLWVDDVNLYYDIVPRRLGALFEHGIYSKINADVLVQYRSRNKCYEANYTESTFKPLSLTASDIGVFFDHTTMVLVAASVVFFVEILWACYRNFGC